MEKCGGVVERRVKILLVVYMQSTSPRTRKKKRKMKRKKLPLKLKLVSSNVACAVKRLVIL